MELPFDTIDHLITYLVAKLAPRVSGKGVLTISLAKLLFLADYEYFKAIGKPATNLRYIWYKYGPYPLTDFEPRLAKLEDYEIIKAPMTRVIDERPYNLFYQGPHPRFTPFLDPQLKQIVDRLIEIFADAPWEALLQYVYSLEIVKGLQSGETIEFGRIAVKTEDETFLDTVADAFREELVKPLSQEHYRVIQKALKEPTNENIENAKRMLPLQRRASRVSG